MVCRHGERNHGRRGGNVSALVRHEGVHRVFDRLEKRLALEHWSAHEERARVAMRYAHLGAVGVGEPPLSELFCLRAAFYFRCLCEH